MAKRKRRRSRSRRRTARRRYRRNPPQFISLVTKGVVGAAYVLAGEAAAGTAARFVAPGGPTNILVKGGVAFLIGTMGRRFVGADAAEKLVIGALLSAARPIVVAANVPFISDALSGDGGMLPGVSAYPQLEPGVSAYPAADADVSLSYGDDTVYMQ